MQSYHRVVFVYTDSTFFNAKTQFTLAQAVRKPEPIWINPDINILLFAHYGYCQHQCVKLDPNFNAYNRCKVLYKRDSKYHLSVEEGQALFRADLEELV